MLASSSTPQYPKSFLFRSMQNLKMLAEDEREVSISRELHHLTISIKLEFVLLLFQEDYRQQSRING